MTLEVGLAFFANIIPRLPILGMDIVTRNEENIDLLVVCSQLRAIDQSWIIIGKVNAEEPSFRIVSHRFKLPFECFTSWCETIPVCFIALVV